jgi:hypothetical protein
LISSVLFAYSLFAYSSFLYSHIRHSRIRYSHIRIFVIPIFVILFTYSARQQVINQAKMLLGEKFPKCEYLIIFAQLTGSWKEYLQKVH